MECENLAYACLTKKSLDHFEGKIAIRWINSDLSENQYTYKYFEENSNIYANVLRKIGVCEKDVVSIFIPRAPELISFFFAVQKNKAISSILFSTLGEEGLFDRLDCSQAKVLITKKSLLKKITPILDKLDHLQCVILIDSQEHIDNKIRSLSKLMENCPADFPYPPTIDSEFPAFLQFTSGSTGKPKGALHVHSMLADIVNSYDEVLQVKDEDIYWCTAEPAWITGLVYGIIAPFFFNTTQVHFSGTFNSEKWLSILQNQKVSVWYTAPTALRMLMQEEKETFEKFNVQTLKNIFSVGEPLNPEILSWGNEVFNRPIYDTWFQSETGCIIIANRPGMEIKPGSMGKPRKGIRVSICDNNMMPILDNKQGLLCLPQTLHSLFRNYYLNQKSYMEKFRADFYLTGDLAWCDRDGYYWYVSRSDDVINTAGHLIGPFEVESALLEITEINDVAVIGTADPILHQKIIAFITLTNGVEWSPSLELKARIHVSNHVSTVAIPAEFRVIDSIPKNQSGKILRRVLKAIYEGKDPGDISTMME